MSTSMGISGGGHPPYAEWVTRLTYEDGHTEDVTNAAREDGSFTVTVPEGVVSAGPSWLADQVPPDREAPDAAPVTFVIPGVTYGGGGGTR